MAHPLFCKAMQGIRISEQERIFCKHGMEHCMDVARILYIMVMEDDLLYDKDVVYAAALLHDIGRYEEYISHTPHHEASVRMAEEILVDCEFSKEETACILGAIGRHKDYDEEADTFCKLLYKADKLSRNCYDCQAQEECYWEENKRNYTIQY